MIFKFEILGQTYSKANSRRKTRSGLIIKSKEALQYEHDFALQCPVLNKFIEGYIKVEAFVFYRSHRCDLDISLILDGMQGRIYKNDNKVKEHILRSWVDKNNPRAYIKVSKSNVDKDFEIKLKEFLM